LKALKYLKNNRPIPEVSSQALVKNRRAAIRWGIQGPFFKETDEEKIRRYPDFFQAYHVDPDGEQIKRMCDAAIAMIKFIQPELEEMKVLNTDYLNPILLSLFGDRSKKIVPPFTTADYQLLLYGKLKDIKNVVREIEIAADNVAANPTYDVLSGVPAAPIWLLPPEMRINLFVTLEPPVVFAGDPITCHLVVENPTDKTMTNPILFVKVLSGDQVFLDKEYPLGELKPKTRKKVGIPFQTRRDITSYQLKALLKTEKAEIPLTQSITTYNVTSKVDLLAPVDCIIIRGRTEIPFMITVENNSPSVIDALMEIQLLEVTSNKILAKVNPEQFGGAISLQPNGHALFAAVSDMLAKKDWAAAVLSAQTGKVTRITPMIFVPSADISSRPLCAIKTIVKKIDGNILSETVSETFRMAVSIPQINWQVYTDEKCDVGLPFSYRARASLKEVSGIVKFVARLVSDSKQFVLEEKTMDLRTAGPIVSIRGGGTVPPDFVEGDHALATFVIDIVKGNETVASYTHPNKIPIYKGVPECKIEIISPEHAFPGNILEFEYVISSINLRGKNATARFYVKQGNSTTTLGDLPLSSEYEGKKIKFDIDLPTTISGNIEIDADVLFEDKVIYHFSRNVKILSVDEILPVKLQIPDVASPGKSLVIKYSIENHSYKQEALKVVSILDSSQIFQEKAYSIESGHTINDSLILTIPAFMIGKSVNLRTVIESKYGEKTLTKSIKVTEEPILIIGEIKMDPPPVNGSIFVDKDTLLKTDISVSANVEYNLNLNMNITVTSQHTTVAKRSVIFTIGPKEKKIISLRVLLQKPENKTECTLSFSCREKMNEKEYDLPPSAVKTNSATFLIVPK
ncbi:MAG: hypothetical protein QXL15_01890, partial [Candidatus Korarchaeota archaeon]